MKYGKKHFSIDENRRDTYQQFHPSATCSEPSLLSNIDGDMKRLMAVCTESLPCFLFFFMAVNEKGIQGCIQIIHFYFC